MTIAPKSNILQNPRPKKANFFSLLTELSFTHFRITAHTLIFNVDIYYWRLSCLREGTLLSIFINEDKKGREEQFLLDLLLASRGDIFVSQLTTLVED